MSKGNCTQWRKIEGKYVIGRFICCLFPDFLSFSQSDLLGNVGTVLVIASEQWPEDIDAKCAAICMKAIRSKNFPVENTNKETCVLCCS